MKSKDSLWIDFMFGKICCVWIGKPHPKKATSSFDTKYDVHFHKELPSRLKEEGQTQNSRDINIILTT